MQRVRIKYSKGRTQTTVCVNGCSPSTIIFIGHLDLIRVWERALRRTDLPVAYSEGYNPRQKMSFGPPLSLGIASVCELFDLYMERWTNPDLVKDELNKVLPEGVEIMEAKNIFSGLASLTAAIKTAVYAADVKEDISSIIEKIKDSKEILVSRKEKQINIRPMIEDISYKDGKVNISVQCSGLGTLRGEEIKGLFPGTDLINLTRIVLL